MKNEMLDKSSMNLLLLGLLVTILLCSSVANVGLMASKQDSTPDKFLLSKGSLRTFLQPWSRGPFVIIPPQIQVFSNNIRNGSGFLDFGKVPLTTNNYDFMKFMPPYQALFYVTNVANHNVSISSIQISAVHSPQPTSPFNFCSLNYTKTSIQLAPGYSQTLSICFFPNKTGRSDASMILYSGPQGFYTVPITGYGIASSKASMTNASSSANNVTSITNHFNMLNHFIQPSINLLATSCSVIIQGGGQRPDPAVDGMGPSHVNPETPPDDGNNITDTPLHHLHKINVGELVALKAIINNVPLQDIQRIQWKIADSKIKDYDESIPGKFVVYNLSSQDYQKPVISFYWKDRGTKNVSVSIEAKVNGQLLSCSKSRMFTVEQNHNDINRQAEDFYTFNHNATVLNKHYLWHVVNWSYPCYPHNGEKFFVFHKGIISNFDAWRRTFGYPQIVTWDPVNNPPKGTDFNDVTRNKSYIPDPIPPYLTIRGGKTFNRCSAGAGGAAIGNGVPYTYNILKLTDFKNADDLSNEVEPTWHGEVHDNIGGDMSGFNTSPKDPVFWEWHKYLDLNLYDKFREAKGLMHLR